MLPVQCNIDKTDRINRVVIGVILCVATFLGFSQVFFMFIGLVLVVQGAVGWCSIPLAVSKIKALLKEKKK